MNLKIETSNPYFNCKWVIITRIEKKQDLLYTKGALNLAFYLRFSGIIFDKGKKLFHPHPFEYNRWE